MNHREKQILCCIETFIENNGYSPTYQEIANIVGLKSRSSVYCYVDNLVKAGHIRKDGVRKVRTITRHEDDPVDMQMFIAHKYPQCKPPETGVYMVYLKSKREWRYGRYSKPCQRFNIGIEKDVTAWGNALKPWRGR